MTVKCHEFFGCNKLECIMFNEGEKRNCWDVDSELTPCADMFPESIKTEDKKVFCENCLYFGHITEN